MCNLKKSKVNFLYSLNPTVLCMALQTSTSQAHFPYESHSLWQISSLFFQVQVAYRLRFQSRLLILVSLCNFGFSY